MMEILKGTRFTLYISVLASLLVSNVITYLYTSYYSCQYVTKTQNQLQWHEWPQFTPAAVESEHETAELESEYGTETDESLECSPCQCNADTTKVTTNKNAKFLTDLNTIVVITPTYARKTQKIDLTSMCHTLMLVPNVVWIIIEDAEKPTDLVTRFIERCDVKIVHLTALTSAAYGQKKGARKSKKPRGVQQRNAGLSWLRQHWNAKNCDGVFYFADDDNKYDLRLFNDIRNTKHVSVWKVGWCGGLLWEGPTCHNGLASSWHCAKTRAFPIDMAAFAINICELIKHPEVMVGVNIHGGSSKVGYLESDFVQHFANKSSVECRGSDKEVYVWHSHTSTPSLHAENHAHSNKSVEI